jgi:hypothetical protein
MRFVALAAVALVASPAAAFEPTDKYARREIQGFTVLVHPEVEKHPEEAKAALAELDAQLKKVCEVVPEKALAAIKKTRIWVEWEAKKNGAMEAHHSVGWLKDNGYNPEKVHSVEINNAKNFVAWSKKTQPWMVLHELAHAYHFTVLGENHAGLHAAGHVGLERVQDRVDERRVRGNGRPRRKSHGREFPFGIRRVRLSRGEGDDPCRPCGSITRTCAAGTARGTPEP